MSPDSTHVPLSPPLPLQPRLLQEPHRFLRDPLLRTLPARGGGLDHAVHNRIRPDVWLRLPAGVEEEEKWREGSGRGGGSSYLHSPSPPAPWSSYQSDAVLGSTCFLFLDHLSVTDQKKLQPGRACCYRGNAAPTPHPLSLPPPPPLLLLRLLFYDIRFHYCTSSAMKPLHLVSSPEPFGRCSAARHERRGDRPMDERNSK